MSTGVQADATGAHTGQALSVYGRLAERAYVTPHRLRKSTLLALSWAIEDQFCVRADAPILFGSFQHQRYWRPSRRRWDQLGALAQYAMVFADFTESTPGDVPVRVAVPADVPMADEWLIVCDSHELPVVLAARELPGQKDVTERDRMFEAVWTIEPEAVRLAARICAQVALDCGLEDARPILYALADNPPPSIIGPAEASELFFRMVAYLDRFGCGSVDVDL